MHVARIVTREVAKIGIVGIDSVRERRDLIGCTQEEKCDEI